MKGAFLVVTSTGNKTVYVPLSRLLRIEAVPPPTSDADILEPAQGHVPTVIIVFEGFQVSVQTSPGQETKVADDLFKRLLHPEDVDLVYLRPDPAEGVTDIHISDI
ncbi:MAG TPA: hypothetical protein VE860_13120 [Chthoniobacterales bacterium]|nr:hypothetical protein [Chthoniobacterales bacterium]